MMDAVSYVARVLIIANLLVLVIGRITAAVVASYLEHPKRPGIVPTVIAAYLLVAFALTFVSR